MKATRIIPIITQAQSEVAVEGRTYRETGCRLHGAAVADPRGEWRG
jgi:hypothetical protein